MISHTNINKLNTNGNNNIYKLYEKGYNIEKLTTGIISQEISSDFWVTGQDKEKLKDVLASDDSIITNLMNKGDDLTIDNLYKAKYKGHYKDFSQEPTREELVALLGANGVKANRETIKAARSLIGGNVHISKANIKVFLNYKSTISNIDVDDIKEIDIREIQETFKKDMPMTFENL